MGLPPHLLRWKAAFLLDRTQRVKRTLSPYFRNLPLLHITIRLHLTSRLLKFMQWLARKQYVLVVGNAI